MDFSLRKPSPRELSRGGSPGHLDIVDLEPDCGAVSNSGGSTWGHLLGHSGRPDAPADSRCAGAAHDGGRRVPEM